MSDGKDGHQLQGIAEAEESPYFAVALDDLAEPYRAKSKGMDSEKHVLKARADALAVLLAVVAFLPVEEDGDEHVGSQHDLSVVGKLRDSLLQRGVANDRKAPGLVVEARRSPPACVEDLLDLTI
jgi:hypothetical protein